VTQSEREALTVIERSDSLGGSPGSGAGPSLHRGMSPGAAGDLLGAKLCQSYPSPLYFQTGGQYAGMGRDLTSPSLSSGRMIGLQLAADSISFTYCFRRRKSFKKPGGSNLMFPLTRHGRYLYPWYSPCAMAGHSLGELTALCRPRLFSGEGFGSSQEALCMDRAAA